MKCCICKKEIPVDKVTGWKEGNNADPVVENGRCCNDCNFLVVIPARLKRMSNSEKEVER